MGKEVRQKRRVRYLNDDRITWSDTTWGGYLNPGAMKSLGMAPAESRIPSALCLFSLVGGAPVDLVLGRRGASEGVSLRPRVTPSCEEGRVTPEGLALRPMTTPGREEVRVAPETRPAASASSSAYRFLAMEASTRVRTSSMASYSSSVSGELSGA